MIEMMVGIAFDLRESKGPAPPNATPLFPGGGGTGAVLLDSHDGYLVEMYLKDFKELMESLLYLKQKHSLHAYTFASRLVSRCFLNVSY